MYVAINIIDYTIGVDFDSSSDYSSSQSNGAVGVVVAIACVITFIVTLIATVIITFIVISIFVKKKFADITKDTTGEQPTATTDEVIYETVGPPSQMNDKADLELPNPGYDTSHKVDMDTNPAYGSSKY